MALQSQSNARKTYRLVRDNVFTALFFSSVVVGVLVLAWLLIEVFVESVGWLDWQFLSSYSSRHPDQAGVLAPIAGTFWVIILTALMTVPVGIATAVYLEEFAPNNRVTRLVQLNISNLAGVPSVVYGLLGLAIFVQYLFDGQRSLLAGALTLSLLVMPIVIIVSQEAIRAVPPSYRDAAYAMGATRWQVVKMVVLPQAIPGMMSRNYSRDVTRDRGDGADLGSQLARVHHLRAYFADRPFHGVAASDRHLGIAATRRFSTHRGGGNHHSFGDVALDERGGHLHSCEVPAQIRELGRLGRKE